MQPIIDQHKKLKNCGDLANPIFLDNKSNNKKACLYSFLCYVYSDSSFDVFAFNESDVAANFKVECKNQAGKINVKFLTDCEAEMDEKLGHIILHGCGEFSNHKYKIQAVPLPETQNLTLINTVFARRIRCLLRCMQQLHTERTQPQRQSAPDPVDLARLVAAFASCQAAATRSSSSTEGEDGEYIP